MAIREHRRIELDAHALLEALLNNSRFYPRFGIGGRPEAVRFSNGGQCAIVTITDRLLRAVDIELDASMLATLILSWCKQLKIPVPYSAEKRLEVTADAVALLIECRVCSLGRTAPPPKPLIPMAKKQDVWID